MSKQESQSGTKSSATMTSSERKKAMDDYIAKCILALPSLSSRLEEFYVTIPVKAEDGTSWRSHTKVVRPRLDQGEGKPRPLIVYFYGGGFVAGNPDLVTSPAREWAERYGATVVLPSYRLTPEVRSPVPMMDGLSTILAIASGWSPDGHQPYFGANPKDGFVIGGVSAGAVVAAVAAGLAILGNESQYKPVNSITGIFLCVPWFFRTENIPEEYRAQWTAMKDNENVEGLNSAAVDAIVEWLQIEDMDSPLVTPAAFFRDGNLTAIPWPRTYFQACQYDPLRDDAIVFEQMLKKAGAQTRLRLFPDDGHAGMSVMQNNHKSKNPTIEEDTVNAMAWLLGID